MKYVQVVPITNIPLSKNQFFTYQTSEEKIKIGQEVIIPFRSLTLRGVVWGFTEKPRFKTKEINKIVRSEILEAEGTVLDQNERKLALWISQYYYCSLGLVIKLMLPPQVKKGKDIIFSRKMLDVKVKLTASQSKVLKTVLNSRKEVFLLHGVTGSGKTEIYLRLCKDILNQGKQVMILVPEINFSLA